MISTVRASARGRRAFLGAATGAFAVASVPTWAQQQPPPLRRIGFLGSESASNQAERLESLRAGLRELGYAEGKNLSIEVRWAEGDYDRLPTLAAELAGLKVSAVVTSGAKATVAMRRATSTIPIVMGSTGDPIALGVVTNLARPGGNVTGWTFFGPELAAKRLELLKEAMPRIARVAFVVNPAYPTSSLQSMQAVAKALKLELEIVAAPKPGEFDRAFAAMAKKQVDAVVIQGDTMFTVHAANLAEIAMRYRLPVAGIIELAYAGGMIGNGPDQLEGHRRAAVYVDKILKGARPGELPIERATKFQLVINLKTAKAIGVAIPQSLLLRADEVIQ